jgi:hypothetical protein
LELKLNKNEHAVSELISERLEPSDKALADYMGLANAITATTNRCIAALRWLDSKNGLSLDEKDRISDEIGSFIVLCADITKIGISHESANLPISLPDKTQMYSVLTDVRNYCATLTTKEGEQPKLENSLPLVASVGFGKIKKG